MNAAGSSLNNVDACKPESYYIAEDSNRQGHSHHNLKYRKI
jgi:hypothetical protein